MSEQESLDVNKIKESLSKRKEKKRKEEKRKEKKRLERRLEELNEN